MFHVKHVKQALIYENVPRETCETCETSIEFIKLYYCIIRNIMLKKKNNV